jgi:hypothetical protein
LEEAMVIDSISLERVCYSISPNEVAELILDAISEFDGEKLISSEVIDGRIVITTEAKKGKGLYSRN